MFTREVAVQGKCPICGAKEVLHQVAFADDFDSGQLVICYRCEEDLAEGQELNEQQCARLDALFAAAEVV